MDKNQFYDIINGSEKLPTKHDEIGEFLAVVIELGYQGLEAVSYALAALSDEGLNDENIARYHLLSAAAASASGIHMNNIAPTHAVQINVGEDKVEVSTPTKDGEYKATPAFLDFIKPAEVNPERFENFINQGGEDLLLMANNDNPSDSTLLGLIHYLRDNPDRIGYLGELFNEAFISKELDLGDLKYVHFWAMLILQATLQLIEGSEVEESELDRDALFADGGTYIP